MELAKISPCQMILIVNVLTFILADGKSVEELNIYGDVIIAIGGLLLVYAGQKDLFESRNVRLIT